MTDTTPTKIENPSWVKDMLEWYAEGMDDYEVMEKLQISSRQFKHYMDSSSDFRELVERGRDRARAFWMRFKRKAVQKEVDVSGDLLKFYMGARYNMGAKNETKEDQAAKAVDQKRAEEELRKQFPDLAARYAAGESLETVTGKALSESAKKH